MSEYKQKRPVDGKGPRWIILNGRGIVIDKNPSKERLDRALTWNFKYNETYTCDRCGINFDNIGWGNPLREYDKEGKFMGWDCQKCWQKYDPNSTNNAKKKLANCRTGNQNPNHECTKGDKDIEIVCELYDWENLNKIYDNYTARIDCRDSETGSLHQVIGRCYSSKYGCWSFSELEREWKKEYKDTICICKSKDGERIERIYRIPSWEIKGRKGITIYRYILKNSNTLYWYEQYRVKDPEELKKANDILQRKLEEDNDRKK